MEFAPVAKPPPWRPSTEERREDLNLEARSPSVPGTALSKSKGVQGQLDWILQLGSLYAERLEAIWVSGALKMEHCCPAEIPQRHHGSLMRLPMEQSWQPCKPRKRHAAKIEFLDQQRPPS